MRAELVYVRRQFYPNLWCFGVVRSRTKYLQTKDILILRRYDLVTWCFGPFRWQFLDWGSRWRYQELRKTREMADAKPPRQLPREVRPSPNPVDPEVAGFDPVFHGE